MAERESQLITVSRQGILIATAVGVGSLTFCYVIGVQVGKRSLTQKSSRAFSIDEELKKLPVPLDQQIDLFKSIDGIGNEKRQDREKPPSPPAAAPTSPAADGPKREPEPTRQVTPQTEPTKQQPQPEPAKQQPAQTPPTQAAPPRSAEPQAAQSERWTAQVAALSDASSANRLAEDLKKQGMPTKIVFENGYYKVRLDWSGTSAELDSRISKLQIMGHKPIRVRLQ